MTNSETKKFNEKSEQLQQASLATIVIDTGGICGIGGIAIKVTLDALILEHKLDASKPCILQYHLYSIYYIYREYRNTAH